jgi:hypothetical protein
MRNHVGVIVALAVCSVLFALLLLGCDAYMKTDSTLAPGKRVTAEQLQGEAATEQAVYAGQLTDLQAGYQKLTQNVTAYNAKQTAAQADLAQKQQTVQQVITTLGGIAQTVTSGTFNPLSLLTSVPTLAISALGIGAMVDKRSLTVALNNARAPGAAPPAAAPSDATASAGVSVILPAAGGSAPMAAAPNPLAFLGAAAA